MAINEAAVPETPVDPLSWTPREKCRAAIWLLALAIIGGLAFYFHPWESDEARAMRLGTEQAMACFAATVITVAGEDMRPKQAKCDVATRNYNRFMNGR
jgi:hypothetical protein